jgi:hypothetical protein
LKRTSLFLTIMLALTGLVAATGSAHADAVMEITGPAAAVEAGTPFTYTVTVPSPNGRRIYSLIVELSGAAATFTGDYSSNHPSMTCYPSGYRADCMIGAFGPEGLNFELTLTVLPTEAGTVAAQVIAFIFDNINAGDTTTTTIIEPAADLEVTLDASSSLLLTSRVVYTAYAFNNGPATSPGSTVTTHLSSPALSVNAGSGCSLSSGHQDVTCPVGALASGSGVDATFTVTFPLLTINLALNATATITGTGTTDPSPDNNTDSAACLAVTSALIVCP